MLSNEARESENTAGSDSKGSIKMSSTILVTICIIAIGFYIRFVVALWRECKPRTSGYWIRLRVNSQTGSVADLQSRSNEASLRLVA